MTRRISAMWIAVVVALVDGGSGVAVLNVHRFLTATLCGSLSLSCLSAVATDPIEPALKPHAVVLAKLESLRDNNSCILDGTRIIKELAEFALGRHRMKETGPTRCDFPIEMAWTPDHEQMFSCEENHNSSCCVNEDGEYDPASNTWVLPQYPGCDVTVTDDTAPMVGTTIVDGTAEVGSVASIRVADSHHRNTQVLFLGPEGMTLTCDKCGSSWCAFEPIQFPHRHNFVQGLVCGLKLASVPDHPEVELCATIEVALENVRTKPYSDLNAVPVNIRGKDIEAVLSGKPVTKVIYLPSPEFQELALATETIVSYQRAPGADPLAEAARRGDIMVVLRIEPRPPVTVERCPEARPARTCRTARGAGRLRCRFGRR